MTYWCLWNLYYCSFIWQHKFRTSSMQCKTNSTKQNFFNIRYSCHIRLI